MIQGQKIFYHDVLECLECLVNKNLEFVWMYQNNQLNPSYSRAWTTQGWLEYENYFERYLIKGAKLLLPYFFLDEYQGRSSKKILTTGIYMGCANAVKHVFYSIFIPNLL